MLVMKIKGGRGYGVDRMKQASSRYVSRYDFLLSLLFLFFSLKGATEKSLVQYKIQIANY